MSEAIKLLRGTFKGVEINIVLRNCILSVSRKFRFICIALDIDFNIERSKNEVV